jgi:hypothetical protein
VASVAVGCQDLCLFGKFDESAMGYQHGSDQKSGQSRSSGHPTNRDSASILCRRSSGTAISSCSEIDLVALTIGVRTEVMRVWRVFANSSICFLFPDTFWRQHHHDGKDSTWMDALTSKAVTMPKTAPIAVGRAGMPTRPRGPWESVRTCFTPPRMSLPTSFDR